MTPTMLMVRGKILLVHRVRKAPKHDAAQATMHHGKSLGVLRNLGECVIDDRQEVNSRLW